MIALDSNILVYAAGQADPRERNEAARSLLDAIAPLPTIVPLQVLGEFLNVCRAKKIVALGAGVGLVRIWLERYDCPPTRPDDLSAAADISARHALQFFDALILTVARRVGATILLSEDMQDGSEIDGVRIVNPFLAANRTLLTGTAAFAR